MSAGEKHPSIQPQASVIPTDPEARYRSLIHGATYGIYRSSADGRFLVVNPALVRMLGYSSEQELLDLDLTTDVFIDASERARLIADVCRAESLERVEASWKRKDGQPIRVRLSGRVVRDDHGEPDGFEVIAEDITQQLLLEDQLRQMQKMEAVGRMAGGIAHDFNNILSVISCYSEILAERVKSDGQMHHYADEIRKVSDRGSVLIRRLMAFSRGQAVTPEILELGKLVEETGSLLHQLTGNTIDLAILPEPDTGKVEIDPAQVDQLLMNLVSNARDAMAEGGKITVETRNVVLDAAYVRSHLGARPGHYVMLAVSDDGCGMGAATRARVFEPFFTTKPAGKGTGLGMATVFGIVKQNHGDVRIYSEVGQGTVVRVYLPRIDAPAVSRARAVNDTRGTETVLVVEDDHSVLRVAQRILTSRGYTVLTAADGSTALDLSKSQKFPIDLLVADSVLPGPNGLELISRVRMDHPDVRVLQMSGYTGVAAVRHGLLDSGDAFIEKPFSPADFARKVREVLDADS